MKERRVRGEGSDTPYLFFLCLNGVLQAHFYIVENDSAGKRKSNMQERKGVTVG